MIRKNDTVRLKIEDITSDGLGVGRADSMAVFVKDTVIGDEVEALIVKEKKTYAYGRLLEVLSPSADRVEPLCAVARKCGGCQLQMMRYDAQLQFKYNRVKNALERIGGFSQISEKMLPTEGMENPRNYRNKAQYPVGTAKGGELVCGFYAGRTHSIIPLVQTVSDGSQGEPVQPAECAIGAAGDGGILKIILAHMQKYRIPAYDEADGTGLLRHVLIRTARGTGQVMVCLIINGEQIPKEKQLVSALREQVPEIACIAVNSNRDRTNVILGQKTRTVSGKDYIEETLRDLRYRISPVSFFQVNSLQAEKLYDTVLRFADLHGKETVLDLYCGTGTISLFLARQAGKVYGIEVVEQAILDARENARQNGISNVSFFAGEAEKELPALYQSGELSADVVVTDPPRKGCDGAVLETILMLSPERIVYVSCDPATLARDLKILCEKDYVIRKVQPVDMFPHTVSIETVCLLSKLSEVKHHINVQVDMDELDLTAAESKATYEEIQEWVQEKYGFHVTHVNIAQVKRKHGIIERENYNKPKSSDSRQPGCPIEKMNAIEEALEFFQMI